MPEPVGEDESIDPLGSDKKEVLHGRQYRGIITVKSRLCKQGVATLEF